MTDLVAAFTFVVNGLEVLLDASGSTAADGATLVAWDWDLGDTRLLSGQSVTTDYASAGTYSVTLTVSDDQGSTATASQLVTVAPPPVTTDTSNLAGGRSRTGSGTDATVHPVVPPPPHLVVTPQRIIATQLPTPVLKEGRPQ